MKLSQINLGQHILKNLATLGPIGYAPIAPGSLGTLAATVFFYFIKPSFPIYLFLLLGVIIIGTIASHKAEKLLNEKDSRHIVIDEFAGYALSIFLIPITATYSLAAFILFRFFDILKPPPIRWIEQNLPGGAGIVADDLMAGVYTNLILQIWMRLI